MQSHRKIKYGNGSVRRSFCRRTAFASLFFCLLLSLSLLIPAGVSVAAAFSAKEEKDKIALSVFGTSEDGRAAEYLASHRGEVPGEAWYAIGIASTGGREALRDYASELLISVHSADGKPSYDLKTALALASVGDPAACAYIDGTVDSLSPSASLNTAAYLLHLAGAGYGSDSRATESLLIGLILGKRLEDGGWAFTGKISDPDMTAIVLQALAPYATGQRPLPAGCDGKALSEAVDGALTLLSSKQLDGGGFSSFGTENSESASQVILALCALGIDPSADERFVKKGSSLAGALIAFGTADGGFSHIPGGSRDSGATAQAFLAFSSIMLYESGGRSVFRFEAPDREAAAAARPVTGRAEAADAGGKEAGRLPAWRIAGAAGVGAAALIGCAALWFAGKRKKGYYITVALCAAAAAAALLLLRIETPGSFGGSGTDKENAVGTVTLTVSCGDIAGRDDLKVELPESGIILDSVVMPIAEGDTVLTILNDAAAKYSLLIDRGGSGATAYIRAINNIGERDFGELSGWLYFVNGESASVGCGSYRLSDGDVIVWKYTLNGVD